MYTNPWFWVSIILALLLLGAIVWAAATRKELKAKDEAERKAQMWGTARMSDPHIE